MWSGVTNGGQKEGTKGTYWRRKEDQEWYDSEGKKGKRRRCSGVGNESELRPGSSGASLQTVLELCSSGTTVGSPVGRMRTMIRRDDGDADDAEWRDERSNRREGERKVTQWSRRREHECDDNERKKGNER